MKNIVEFGLNTRIHPVSIIFKDEATNDIRIHLGRIFCSVWGDTRAAVVSFPRMTFFCLR